MLFKLFCDGQCLERLSRWDFCTTNYFSMKHFSVIISFVNRATCSWKNTAMSSHGMDQDNWHSAYPQWRFLDGRRLFAGIDVNHPSKRFVDSVPLDHRNRATPEPLIYVYITSSFVMWSVHWRAYIVIQVNELLCCAGLHTPQRKLCFTTGVHTRHMENMWMHAKKNTFINEKKKFMQEKIYHAWDIRRPLQLIFGGMVIRFSVRGSKLVAWKKLHPVRKWRVWFGMKAER